MSGERDLVGVDGFGCIGVECNMDGGQRLWDCFGFIWVIVGIWRSLDILCAHFGLLGLLGDKGCLGAIGMCDIVWANHLELRVT